LTTDVIPLGTAGAIPTRDRHLSSVAVERKGRVLLLDCGEGTQYRLLHASLNRARVDAVFVTHLHGDHLYGLPGLAATVGQLQRTASMTVVGPRGIQRFLAAAAGVSERETPYGLDVVELDVAALEDEADTEAGSMAACVYETEEFTVEARPLDHRVPTVGYRFQEKPRRGRFDPDRARELGVTDPQDFGRLHAGEPVTTADGVRVSPDQVVGPDRPGIALAYCTDTRPCEGARILATGADLLIHDATFTHDLADHADETGHSTARQAADIAHTAGVDQLLLTHISARYDSADVLADDARSVFPASEVARELHRIVLDPREKWG